MEQLERLQKDLGHGEAVVMDTHNLFDSRLKEGSKNPEIGLGANLAMEEEQEVNEEAEEEEEHQELQSFQRFLAREHKKSLNVKPS